MGCPVKTKEYKELEAIYGEGRTLAAWTLNNEQVPTVEQAAVLLGIQRDPLFQLPSTEGKIVAEQTIKDIASRMSERIGMDVRFESDRTKEYKGKIDGNTAIINLAYATMDTPIHEILGHPIIRAIKENKQVKSEPNIQKENGPLILGKISIKNTLYNNLLKELETGTGKEVLDRIKRDYTVKRIGRGFPEFSKYGVPIAAAVEDLVRTGYSLDRAVKWLEKNFEGVDGEYMYFNFPEFQPEFPGDEGPKPQTTITEVLERLGIGETQMYSLEEQQEEALVELLGMMTADRLDRVKDGKLISLLKRLLKEIASYVRSLLGAKEIEIEKLPDNMTLSDIADVLAYSNSKLILPGYEVLYTTPDNQQFKSYGEASKHISDLAKSNKETDLTDIKILPPKDINLRIKEIKESGKAIYTAKFTDGYYWRVRYTTEKVTGADGYTREPGWVEERGTNKDNIPDVIYPLNEHEAIEKLKNTINKKEEGFKDDLLSSIDMFIKKNKEFEQSEEIIEKWKKINNIKYNPEEVYSRGQGFYSVVGAYSDFDVNLMFQNILHHIEDNQKAGGEFVISAFTKPVDRNIGHLESGGGKIKFVIYPQPEDIKWAANADVFSGSVWDASAKVSKDKKSELLGVSYTKAPALNNLDAVKPNLAEIIDNLAHHHNELGIALTGKNFRIEYDNNIPTATKKILNSVNSILDQKYGKLNKPEIGKITSIPNEFEYYQQDMNEDGGLDRFRIKISKKEDTWYEEFFDTYGVSEYVKQITYNEVKTHFDEALASNSTLTRKLGIQPTITSANVKESITSFKDKQDRQGEFGYYKEEVGENDYVWYVTQNESEIGSYETEKEAKAEVEKLKKGNKKYTYKALVNKKIAALKEVAKKYPRSLIRSEVKRKMSAEYGGYAQPTMFDDELPFQKTPTQEPSVYITNNIRKFIESLGGTITYTGEIIINGQVISANAVANVITRSIQIANGQEGIDTLPEEAAHIYIHWLPKTSSLYRDMMAGIRTMPEYRKTLAQYRSNPMYQNPDGTVDENKIAIEAIGKVIASRIVGGSKSPKVTGWFNRLIEWVKNLFRGREFDPFAIVASDIVTGNTKRLDLEAMKKAEDNGLYYFQLSDEDTRFYKTLKQYASPQQKAIIEDLVENPEVVLIESTHTYKGREINDTTEYTSVSNGIGVEFTGDAAAFEPNRQWGNNFDTILKGVVENKSLSAIDPTPYISEEVRQQIYNEMDQRIGHYKEMGWIVLTQVPIADKDSGIAGTMDLVLVSPEGMIQVVDLKTSWSRTNSTNYSTKKRELKGDSKIRTEDRTAITKYQQHGIQTGAYAKMLQIKGYNNQAKRETWNYTIQNTGDIATGFFFDAVVPFDPTFMQSAVDTLIPTPVSEKNRLEELGVENVFRTKEFQESFKESTYIPPTEYTQEESDKLDATVTKQLIALYTYRKELHELARSRGKAHNIVLGQQIEELNKIILNIEYKTGDSRKADAFVAFLDYVNAGINKRVDYLSDRNNASNPNYAGKIAEMQTFLRNMQTIINESIFTRNDRKVVDKVVEVQENIRNAQDVVVGSANRNVTQQIIKENTARELSDAALAEMTTKAEDISDIALKVGDMDNSGSPILENMAKDIKMRLEKQREIKERVSNEFRKAAEALNKAFGGKKDSKIYDPLFQVYSEGPKKGQRTGRMISQAGMVYWNMYDRIMAKQLNELGEFRSYIENPRNQAELEYNKNLYWAKKERREFESAEEIDGTNVSDGKYHFYDPVFIEERKKWMYINNGRWIEKPEVREDPEFFAFREKYYNFVDDYYLVQKKDGIPTGYVQKQSIGEYFVKPQYVFIRDTASDGTLLADPVYNRLQNAPKGSQDNALWEYYKTYRNVIGQMVEMLPAQYQVWYQKGYVPTISSSFMQQLSREGADKMKLVMASIKDMFSIKAYTNQSDVNKLGSLSQSLPIFYTANLKNQAVIDAIDEAIQLHAGNKSLATTPEEIKKWVAEKKRLQELKEKELHKLSGDEIHPDLTEGALHFIEMSNNFFVHDSIKDILAAVEGTVKNMEFTEERKNFWDKTIGRVTKKGESRTLERLKGFLQFVYMYDNTYDKNTLHILSRKLMSASSGLNIAFNLIGHANNLIMGKINNHVNSYGDEFFKRSELFRMEKEQTLAMAAMAAKMGDNFINNKSYLQAPPSSRYEALTRLYNMVEHRDLNDPGKVELFGKWGYGTMEGGEWIVQSQTGNAILGSIILRDKNGNEKSIYDAYTFNKETGELTLEGEWYTDDGTLFDKEQQYKVHNRIRETNKWIHGNYRAIDRTQMERLWYGKFIMQYHKWVYPAIQNRLQPNRFNENIGGGMYLEGRYRSFMPFIKGLADGSIKLNQMWNATFADLSKMTKEEKREWVLENLGGMLTLEEYESLSDERKAQLIEHRRNNIKKNIMEILYICMLYAAYTMLKKLADGVDDDDPNLRKLVNWSVWQADRSIAELSLFTPLGLTQSYDLIKNPIAALGVIGDFGQLVNAMVKYPFISDKDRIYQRGVHKGDLKLYKEAKDIIPIVRISNKITAFGQIKDFGVFN